MELKDVKYNLKKRVLHTNKRLYLKDVPYILNRVILDKDEKGNFFYVAEIRDVNAPYSVSEVSLDSIREADT
jgi:hypothetical protein